MLRNRGNLFSYHARIAILCALLSLIAVIGPPAISQQNDIVVTKPPAPTGEDPLVQAMQGAQNILNDGLTTMNEDTLRRAAGQYEQIIVDYKRDPRYFDAYFYAANIYMDYLQTVPDYHHAQNLLTQLITEHPSNYTQVLNALIIRADLEYRCLFDYRAAQEDLSAILNNSFLSSELGDRDVQVKAILAKCRQKLEDFGQASTIWEEIDISNPELDSEGRLQFIDNATNWMKVQDSRMRLFFEDDIPPKVYQECVNRIHDGLAETDTAWGLTPSATVDVYLYSSPAHLFDYTRRSQAFALPADAEIYLSASDLDSIGHLTGWVETQRVNSRVDQTVFPFLRAGFQHYFMGTRDDIDKGAAKAIYFYGDTLKDYEILFPLSFNYTYSDEYGYMASSFLHYLVEDKGVKFDDLERFYRLLWSKPDSRYIPPLIAALMSETKADIKILNAQGDILSADQVYGLFKTVLGVGISSELTDWQASLADDIEAVKVQAGTTTAQVENVDIDLSTPQKALESWWNAYRNGDFDGLIASSTKDVAQMFKDARDLYVKQGIFDQVVQENFVRPFHNATMDILKEGQYAEDLYVFQVKINSDQPQERSIVVRKESGKWKIDSN